MARKKKPESEEEIEPKVWEYVCNLCGLVFDGTLSSVCPKCEMNFVTLKK